MVSFANDDNGNAPLYYVPITLGANDGSGFEQQVVLNASTYSADLASNLSNINFQDGAGNLLNSWQETHGATSSSSSVVYWVDLPNGTITTIYAVFVGTSNSSLSLTHTGAEPNFTGTYGQYDNGATVFLSLYDNFAGTTLNGSLWALNGGSATVSNGVNFGASSNNGGMFSTQSFADTFVVDYLGSMTSANGNYGNSGFVKYGFGFGVDGFGLGFTAAGYGLASTDGLTNAICVPAVPSYSLSTVTIVTQYIVSGTEYLLFNYIQVATNTLYTPTFPMTIGGMSQTNLVHNWFFQWIRVRHLPTGGTMPSQTFGSVTPVTAPFISVLMVM